jgi:hypothetical protein
VQVERTADEKAEIDAISTEYDALVEKWSHLDELPPEVEARLAVSRGLRRSSRCRSICP